MRLRIFRILLLLESLRYTHTHVYEKKNLLGFNENNNNNDNIITTHGKMHSRNNWSEAAADMSRAVKCL